MSVEGAVARLRRAPLAASLASRRHDVTTIAGPHGHPAEAEVHPYRPRTRALPAPTGGSLDRVRQILDVGGGDTHAELVTLDPAGRGDPYRRSNSASGATSTRREPRARDRGRDPCDSVTPTWAEVDVRQTDRPHARRHRSC